jgi:hypothetical protein
MECILGYILAFLGLEVLITGADLFKSQITDENKLKKTGVIMRIIALPVAVIGIFLFMRSVYEPSSGIEGVCLIGSLLMIIPGLLTLITGWNVFKIFGMNFEETDKGTLRKLGLFFILAAAVAFLRWWYYDALNY